MNKKIMTKKMNKWLLKKRTFKSGKMFCVGKNGKKWPLAEVFTPIAKELFKASDEDLKKPKQQETKCQNKK